MVVNESMIETTCKVRYNTIRNAEVNEAEGTYDEYTE